MSPRTLIRIFAATRVAIGVALLIAPRRVVAGWLGKDAATPEAAVVGRALGARDAVFGGMLLHTVDHPQVGKRWTTTCAAVDAVDGLASLGARRGIAVGLFALASAAAHAALAQQLDSPEGLADVAAQSPPAPASSPETVMPDGAEEAKRAMGARTIGVDPPGAS